MGVSHVEYMRGISTWGEFRQLLLYCKYFSNLCACEVPSVAGELHDTILLFTRKKSLVQLPNQGKN